MDTSENLGPSRTDKKTARRRAVFLGSRARILVDGVGCEAPTPRQGGAQVREICAQPPVCGHLCMPAFAGAQPEHRPSRAANGGHVDGEGVVCVGTYPPDGVAGDNGVGQGGVFVDSALFFHVWPHGPDLFPKHIGGVMDGQAGLGIDVHPHLVAGHGGAPWMMIGLDGGSRGRGDERKARAGLGDVARDGQHWDLDAPHQDGHDHRTDPGYWGMGVRVRSRV